MNQPKFTPGEWKLFEHGGTFYIFAGPDGEDMVADNPETDMLPDSVVARIRGVGRDATEEEQRANGLLISAGPKMYAACELALLVLDSEGCASEDPDSAFMKLKAAIAKADGATISGKAS